MARPPLVMETWGRIRRTKRNGVPIAVANYRDSDGVTRRMERSGKTEAAAERVLLAALRERLTPAETLKPESYVRDLAKLWLEEIEGKDLALGTLAKYRDTVNKHILPGLRDVRIQEAGTARLDRFIKTLREKRGASAARIARVVLSGMFGLAARHGVVKANPVRDVAPVRVVRKPVAAPSVSDIPKMRALFRLWDAGVTRQGRPRGSDVLGVADLFAGTGMRTGEAMALKWSEVDLGADPPTVSVVRTIALDEHSKGFVQEKPKSDTSRRVLKIPKPLAETLMDRRVNAISEYVFPNSLGTFQSPYTIRTQWRNALKGTEYEGVTPKSFRKAVATMLRDVMGVGAAKDQLGHSSEQVTNQHYVQAAHAGPDATAALEAFFKL